MIKYKLGTFRLNNEEKKKKQTEKQKQNIKTKTYHDRESNPSQSHERLLHSPIGIKFFFADENVFLTGKIKRYLQNNGIVFSYVIFKTCRIL